MSSAKTPVSLDEIKERFNNSSNEQIGKFFLEVKGVDPFRDPKNKFVLPSAIRAQCINQIITWYNAGGLWAQK